MIRSTKQGVLFSDEKMTLIHGGESRAGKRKVRRPIALKRPMHFVFKSSQLASSSSFLLKRNREFISNLLKKEARLSGIRIYHQSINSNHIHLATYGKSRFGYQRFLRVVSSKIAQFITRAQKTKPLSEKFWDNVPFSRIVEWGLSFKTLTNYIQQNILESQGMIRYTPRNNKPTKASTE